MHGKRTNTVTPERPSASESAIREMHDRASAAAHRAAQHDTDAIRIVNEAEAGAEQMRRDAAKLHEERMESARRMAADNIAKAEADAKKIVEDAKRLAAQHVEHQQAEADAKRRQTEVNADENLQQAYRVAQQERDKQAAEQRDRDYWTSLASAEAAAAGLPAVPPTAEFPPVPDDGLKPEATS
jgi:hypothetical protein